METFKTPYPTQAQIEFDKTFAEHMAKQPTPPNPFPIAVLLMAVFMVGLTVAPMIVNTKVPAPKPAVESEHLTSAWTGTVETKRGR